MKTVSRTLCFLTFLFDLLLSLIVCLILGYGVWIFLPLIHVWNKTIVITTFIVSISFVLMISLASLIGCVGVCRKNAGILFASASFNTFVLLLLLNFIVFACFSREMIEEKVKTDMFQSLKEYNKSCTNGYSSPGWHALQLEYECCGVLEYQDWLNNSKEEIPYSCALKEVRTKQPISFLTEIRKNLLPEKINTIGCLTRLKQNIKKGKINMFLFGGLLEVLVILAIVLTCYLGKKVRDIDMYDPQLATEDFELTKILRKSQNRRHSRMGTLKGSRLDLLRGNDNPYPTLTHSIHDERLINFAKL